MDLSAAEYARRDTERLREVLSGPPVTWAFIGDSITQGVTHTHGWRNYVELFAERVRGELGRVGDAVINSGASGSTTEDVLTEFHWRAGRFTPDVLFVMFGTNDVLDSEDGVRGFRFRLDQIVQQGRDVGATVVLQTPPAVRSEGERTPEALADYAQAVREVGQSLGVLVVDHAAAWAAAVGSGSAGSGSAGSGPAGSEPGSSAPAGWLDDAFHPGPAGHHALALTLLEALHLADPSSAVCQLARESIAALA